MTTLLLAPAAGPVFRSSWYHERLADSQTEKPDSEGFEDERANGTLSPGARARASGSG